MLAGAGAEMCGNRDLGRGGTTMFDLGWVTTLGVVGVMFLGIICMIGLCGCGAISCCWEGGMGRTCGLLTRGIVGGIIGCRAVFCPSSAATC
eukprot:167432-Ditylum_brightwellii.AAC.1